MDKLMEILNSMRNNSCDVDAKLTSFMEEAQNSANSEEMLGEIVRTIYQKAVSDRSFAFTAAKLCDKMALFMVEGTKFRSLLLNMLQVTEHLQTGRGEGGTGDGVPSQRDVTVRLAIAGTSPQFPFFHLINYRKGEGSEGAGLSSRHCVCMY